MTEHVKLECPAKTYTEKEWKERAVALFGQDHMKWRFVCPSCGHIATVQDWKNAGASEGEVGFSCVGRHLGAGDESTFKNSGGPCNYAGGGLFRINPVLVKTSNGDEVSMFDFAEDPS